ncbi:Sec-independent protein translocase subunit TatA/TatB [Fodinibius salsisoli]|uniref:Twin-arginine translocase TatA/TatE family subunit n=1 Tax=Fodinibius salsisoli TaxID=2820877 RepID=A0ABT3PJ26_9BACT|nr:twin-arginine translocase TatA/TatE family subunit [Fodinibius salsisoli]MCW9705932.1 twin-arginine translocase TatA/TatE family subunit [Fodinibius salsisoli]
MAFGATEIVIILAVIVVFFFGAKKIPELARGIGQGFKEFKKVSEDSEPEDNKQETHTNHSN